MKWKQLFLGMVGAGALTAAEPRQLIDKELGQVLVEEQEGKLIFHDKVLEEEMRECGIRIPLAVQAEYGGKEYLFLGDEGFERAFCELFVRDGMDARYVRWTD